MAGRMIKSWFMITSHISTGTQELNGQSVEPNLSL